MEDEEQSLDSYLLHNDETAFQSDLIDCDIVPSVVTSFVEA